MKSFNIDLFKWEPEWKQLTTNTCLLFEYGQMCDRTFKIVGKTRTITFIFSYTKEHEETHVYRPVVSGLFGEPTPEEYQDIIVKLEYGSRFKIKSG